VQMCCNFASISAILASYSFRPAIKCREVVSRDESKLGLKFARLVFDDFIDVAHSMVVDVVTSEKSGAI
jgi:hypothetical protein